MSYENHFYWLDHKKFVLGNRLAWYAEQPDEDFWYTYWNKHINIQYFEKARLFNLEKHPLGQILLNEMGRDGLHIEAGCGSGFWVTTLRQYGYNVEGIEYSQNLVGLVNRFNPDLPVCYGNALHIDVNESYYDTYLSFGVVEHTPDGPEMFLREAYRVIKPNGKIIISVPMFGMMRRLKAQFGLFEPSLPISPFFQYGFTRNDFCKLLKVSGFQINSVHFLYIDRMLLEEIPFYRRLRNSRVSNSLVKIFPMLLQKIDGHMMLIVGRK